MTTKSKRHRGLARILIASTVVLAATGCGGGGSGSKAAGSGGPEKVTSPAFYGLAPAADSHVQLQPDVVMIGGGPKAIRSASGDGLTWVMDGSAPGVKDLAPGKVMMASTFATGRVVKVEPRGKDVAVSLAPVEINEVVKDGHLASDTPLDLSGARVMAFPDAPGALGSLPSSDPSASPSPGGDGTDSSAPADSPSSTDSGGDTTPTDSATDTPTDTPTDTSSTDTSSTDTPPADQSSTDTSGGDTSGGDTSSTDTSGGDTSTAATSTGDSSVQVAPADTDPPAAGAAPGVKDVQLAPVVMDLPQHKAADLGPLGNTRGSIQVGPLQFEPYTSKNLVRMRVSYNGGGDGSGSLGVGLKMGIDFDLNFSDHAKSHQDVTVSGGQVKSSSMSLSGLDSVGVTVSAAAANGLKDNNKWRIEVPVDIIADEVVVYGVPTAQLLRFKVVISLGFSTKQSTLTASSLYHFDGDVGVQNGQAETPKVTMTTNPVKTLSGVSVAGTGLVVAFEVKASWGFGVPAFSAGPYVKLVLSTGLTDGSAIGMVHCSNAQVILTLSTGVGVNMSAQTLSLFKDKLKLPIKGELESQFGSTELFKLNASDPDVAACKIS